MTDLHAAKLLRSPSVRSSRAHAQFQLLVEVAVENASVPTDVDRVPVQTRDTQKAMKYTHVKFSSTGIKEGFTAHSSNTFPHPMRRNPRPPVRARNVQAQQLH